MILKKTLLKISIILLLCFSVKYNYTYADESIYSISANTAITGQEYVLIIVNGERDNLALVDNDDSILYIQQKTASSEVLTFDNIMPIEFEKATAFIISQEGVLVKCLVLDNLNVNILKLPSNVKIIEKEAFMGISVSVVEIPDGVTTIRSGAFKNCSSLKKIVIPSSVSVIESDVFQKSPDVVIYGYSESRAETYAQENGFTFVLCQ